jgi:chemotaxis protein MotB
MAVPAKPPEEAEEEEWILTYADAITLLMAFFVMLLTFTKYDIPAFEKVKKGISEAVGHRDNEQTPTELLKIEIEDVVASMQAEEVAKVTKDDKGILIELDSSAFYKPGSADILNQARPLLKNVSDLLVSPTFRFYNVEIEGHTDDDPISTPRYPSNWELSAGRATRVARFFVKSKIDPLRLKATGFAATRPVVPNRDSKGKPLKKNMAKNRRVIIRVFPMDLGKRGKIKQAEAIKLTPKLGPDLEDQFKKRQEELKKRLGKPGQKQPPGQPPVKPGPAQKK